MFKASIDSSLAHSWNTWGLAHHSITAFAAKDLVYIVIALGALWVALNSLRTVRPFTVFGLLKTGVIDALFILILPVGIATVISEVASKIYVRPRPFAAFSDIHLVTPHAADGGFPSHHAVFMAAIVAAIYIRSKSAGVVLGVLTVICGAARIAAGIHYPTDILAGLVIGAGVTVLTNRVLLQLLRK